MSADALQQWDLPVNVAFIEIGQDWQERQKLQYAALEGLMKADFLGLKDWTTQISTYSKANPAQLSAPMAAIAALTSQNAQLMTGLTDDPDLGLVGNYLLQVAGFADIVLHPEEILDSDTLDGALGI
jgi:hypothetical protein